MTLIPAQFFRRERIPDNVYLELIGELFKMLPPHLAPSTSDVDDNRPHKPDLRKTALH